MFALRHFAAVPALVVLMGGTAHAALTADQVWQSWKDGAAVAGLVVTTATEAKSGASLTLNGVSVQAQGAAAPLTVSDITLTENPDGSVTIVPGASIAFTTGDSTEGASVKVAHDGLEIVASEGEGGAIVYDYSAAKLSVAFDSVAPGYSFTDQPAKPVTTDGDLTFTDLEGAYTDTPGTNRVLGLELAAASLAYSVNSDDANMPLKSTSVSEMDDPVISAELTLPSTIALGAIKGAADFKTALLEGLALTASMTQGDATGSSSQEDEFFPYSMTMTSLPGESEIVFNKDSIGLTTSGKGGEAEFSSPGIPAPVKLSMGEISIALLSPVIAIEEAGDYAFGFAVDDLVLNEEAWALFDPGASLNRDAAAISIDLTGKTRIDLPTLMEPMGMGPTPPSPEPETLDINDLSLTVAGAALKALGAFTFDNSMGVPMPLGSADVTVSGADQLIDGLVAVGLLTEDDAQGAKMMMGAFMVPGADPDTLTSKIEAKEGGAIFVNGQQVQ